MSDRDEFYNRFSKSYDKLHQSEMQDDLVERVAHVFWETPGTPDERLRAAIAVALEEAAKVADAHGLCDDGDPDCQGCGEEIAAAIRARINKE